jgi:hypothetical protein
MSQRIPVKVLFPDGRRAPASSSLPGEIVRHSARRLRMAATVWIALWSIGLALNNLLGPLISPGRPLDDAWPWPGNPVAFGCIALSLGIVLYTRRRPALSVFLNLALVYEVALAFAIGVVNQWTPNTSGLSWICVLILVHPLIVPDRPLRTFVAATLAASMDLVGLAITGARGVAIPDWPVLLWTYLPNFICAALAVVPAQIIGRLGREVRAARELGSYQLGERLGVGGMGEVYHARHRLLARPVAIKLVRPELVGDVDVALEAMTRFEREAQATARMRSPHTIQVYDCGVTDEGVFYYVMELLEGYDLDQLVRTFGPQPPARVVHVLRQVCDSLAEAHAQQLIHRDIKPANVHLCRYGRRDDFVKLLDFGLVKHAGTTDPGESAIDGRHVTGTPSYMAPEQALRTRPVDGRTDLYGVGCVAYWLLTGRPVFEGHTSYEVITRHAMATPVPPSSVAGASVPACVDRVVLACLEKDMERRPATAEALDAMLAECAAVTGAWTDEMARRWWETLGAHPEHARNGAPTPSVIAMAPTEPVTMTPER